MTPDTRYIRPAPGKTIIDPATQEPLPAHGCAIAWGSFWQRRFDQGDVAMTTAEEIAAAEEALEAATTPAPDPATPARRSRTAQNADASGDDK